MYITVCQEVLSEWVQYTKWLRFVFIDSSAFPSSQVWQLSYALSSVILYLLLDCWYFLEKCIPLGLRSPLQSYLKHSNSHDFPLATPLWFVSLVLPVFVLHWYSAELFLMCFGKSNVLQKSKWIMSVWCLSYLISFTDEITGPVFLNTVLTSINYFSVQRAH